MACPLGGAPENICGFCMYHKRPMTVRQLRSRNCLGKQCTALSRKEDHPFWKQREASKKKRAARKERIEAELAKYGHGNN